MFETITAEANGEVRAMFDAYYEAFRVGDAEALMAFFEDDAVIDSAVGLLEGKAEILDQFVQPVVTGFPGCRHVIRNMLYGDGVVAIEWHFEARHTGPFAGLPPSGNEVGQSGSSIYTFDLARRRISGRNIYFDMLSFLKQCEPA